MQLPVSSLDWAHLEQQVRRAVDSSGRFPSDPLLQRVLDRAPTTEKAISVLLFGLIPPLGKFYRTVADLDDDSRLIEALVRCTRHPNAPVVPHAHLDVIHEREDAIDRIREIAAAHPEWTWDLAEVRRALVAFLCTAYGEHRVNPAQVPWMMAWRDAEGVAESWMLTIVFDVLGRLA